MTYELKAGKRGSFTVGGPFAGPLKIAGGLLLGIGAAAFVRYSVGKDTDYFDPSNEYYVLAIVGLIGMAVLAPVIIWTGVKKECVRLTLSPDTRVVQISWRGVFWHWMETLAFDHLQYFDVRAEGGRFQLWTLVLRTSDGETLDVGKFRESKDAEREKEEANRVLQQVAPDLKGVERDWRS